MPTDELYPNNFLDIKKVLMVQNPINIFLALLAKLLIGFEFLDLLIFILKFLQP